jgi:hypothetical protein
LDAIFIWAGLGIESVVVQDDPKVGCALRVWSMFGGLFDHTENRAVVFTVGQLGNPNLDPFPDFPPNFFIMLRR